MNAPESGDRARELAATSLSPDEPMTDELCRFVLTLAADGRGLPDRLLARAREHAARHPACAEAVSDMAHVASVLGSEPPLRPSAGFTERVVAAAAGPEEGGLILRLPEVARTAAAAVVLLAGSLWFAVTPGRLVADDEIAAQPGHAVDHFRAAELGQDDLDSGLRGLLPDPTPRAEPSAGESAR